MSVFVVLHEKGLPFQCHGVDLDGGANLQPDYAAASLTARVPLLVEGDFRLSAPLPSTWRRATRRQRMPRCIRKTNSGVRVLASCRPGCVATCCLCANSAQLK
nr:hypothetical protein [Vogesella sp. XCS3]